MRWWIGVGAAGPLGVLALTLAPGAQAHPVDEEPAGSPYEGTVILYLNRCEGGLTVVPGEVSDATQDVSSLLTAPVDFFPYPYGEASWDAVLAHTREILRPFRIIVTDVSPSPAPHDEVVVCGNALQAGYAGLPGAAPLRCTPSQNPMSFVFAEDAPARDRERYLAELVIQEAAHAWSLDHVVGCADAMGFSAGCGPKTVLDEDLACGTVTVKNCACGGKQQNSHHVIAGLFGLRPVDETAPVAQITEPADGTSVSADATVNVAAEASDDFTVAEIALWLDGQPIAAAAGVTTASWPLQGLPVGPHTLHVAASDQDGNVATSATIAITVEAVDDPSTGPSTGDGTGVHGDSDTAAPPDGTVSSSDDGTSPPNDAASDANAGCGCHSAPDQPRAPWQLLLPALAWLVPRRKRMRPPPRTRRRPQNPSERA